MHWLVALPTAVLVIGWLVVMLGVAALSRFVVRAVVPTEERGDVPAVAGPLMPALGATFAVLMALTLASEATVHRSAADTVSTEAAQSSRLAWAATTPGIDTEAVQQALEEYLRQTRADEWHGDTSDEQRPSRIAERIASLEQEVRAQAARPGIGTPASSELLSALDSVISARRDRLAAATGDLPWLYVVTLVVSGVALVANAGALTFRSSLRTSHLVVGLAVVVASSLALLFALTAPWDGALVVSGQPIDAVVSDLQAGFFRP